LFNPDGRVAVQPLQLSAEALSNLEDNLLLFFTDFTRAASTILAEQDNRTKGGDSGMLNHLHQIKRFGYESKAALESGDLRGLRDVRIRFDFEGASLVARS